MSLNSLPVIIRNIDTYDSFKNLQKKKYAIFIRILFPIGTKNITLSEILLYLNHFIFYMSKRVSVLYCDICYIIVCFV